jgi:3-deoxy-manno-octulosonate cytidylyltransferase (CMP-KDO synthetase)
VLQAYAGLPPSALEDAEKLEQLRLLSAGYRIRAYQVEPTGPGVDTPEGLEEVKAILLGEDRPQPRVADLSLTGVKLVVAEVADKILDAQGKTDHLYSTSASSQQTKSLRQ